MKNFLCGTTPLCLALSAAAPCLAQSVPGGFIGAWQQNVTAEQAEQPAWVAPIATTTPLLVQQFRDDATFSKSLTGIDTTTLGGGKGLELVPPIGATELLFALPPYVERDAAGKKPAVDGFGDGAVLSAKERLFSGNAANGDYVVTALLTFTAPTGIRALTNDAYAITPALGLGKGFGPFVIQATSGVSIPLQHTVTLSKSWQNNIAFQYHLLKYFWPEFELNETSYFDGGKLDGKNQLFATFGAVVGKIGLGGRNGLAFGAAYQEALAPTPEPKLPLPAYDHAWILSARIIF